MLSRILISGGLLALLVAFSGCSARVNKEMQSWVGHHQSELILAWGPPAQTSSDGNGGEVLIYQNFVNLGQSQGSGHIDQFGNFTYIAPQQQGWNRVRMFWVNPEGVIYSWRWQGL